MQTYPKQQVICVTFLDGKEHRRIGEFRRVYSNRKGAFIRSMGRQFYLVNGCEYHRHISTIHK